jgi:2-aminobenzoate-CoA ligase
MNPPRPVDTFVSDRLPAPADQPYKHHDTAFTQLPDRLNLVSHLLDAAAANGWSDRPFLRSPGETLSFGQARTRIERLSAALTQAHSLVPGNRVLLRGPNSISTALAWLAVVRSGLIAVATMPLLRAQELEAIIRKAQPALALCDSRLLDELQIAARQAPLPGGIVPLNAPQTPGSLEHAARSQPASTAPPCDTAADDIALLAFTSGTTGVPKAAAHSHRDVMAACESWPRHCLKATPDDIVLGSPPLAFTFGLGGLLLFPLWAGASVYFADAPHTPAGMASLIHDTGATICYTAPTFYRQMAPHMQAEAARRGRAPALRRCVSAGEGLPNATRLLWKEATGLDLLDGIGATELFHIFISSDPEAGPLPSGALGRAVPGYVARVVDGQGLEVQRGTVGRLAVTGPTGCNYLDDTRQSAYVQQGWNFPGDAFIQDAQGLFYYQARADDMIITAGYNVGGPEVEDALLRHAAVAECAVVGQPDDERGMLIHAYCVLRPGHAPGPELVLALQNHVKHTLAPYKYPRAITFLSQLPRTETGKLQRYKLRQP